MILNCRCKVMFCTVVIRIIYFRCFDIIFYKWYQGLYVISKSHILPITDETLLINHNTYAPLVIDLSCSKICYRSLSNYAINFTIHVWIFFWSIKFQPMILFCLNLIKEILLLILNSYTCFSTLFRVNCIF